VDGTIDFAQHALFARFHDGPIAEAESILRDHRADHAIAVVAGLDREDLAVKALGKAAKIGEGSDSGLGDVRRYGQGIFGALEVGPHHLDRSVGQKGPPILEHARLPVAEIDVDLPVLDRRIGDRYRQDLRDRSISQPLEKPGGQRGRGGDVGPADIGEAYRAAAVRFDRTGPRRPQAARESEQQHASNADARCLLERAPGHSVERISRCFSDDTPVPPRRGSP
jgi:hypothetical protein